MKQLKLAKEAVKGYKTYAIALAMVVYAVLGYLLQYSELPQSIEIVFEALAIAGLRAGVSKR